MKKNHHWVSHRTWKIETQNGLCLIMKLYFVALITQYSGETRFYKDRNAIGRRMWPKAKSYGHEWAVEKYSAFLRFWREKWVRHTTVQHQSFTDFEKAYDWVRREVLYNILIKFGTHIELVTLIKMCPNETKRKVHLSENLIYILFRIVWNKMFYRSFFCFWIIPPGGSKKIRRDWNWMDHTSS
jgi:hypothetical protein